MNKYKLFIDELGQVSYKGNSKVYVTCACSIEDKMRMEAKIKADQIKYKYWGRTDIVFHSRDMGRTRGEFSILSDKVKEKHFYEDLFNFLNWLPVILFVVVIEKYIAYKSSWNDVKIIKESANKIFGNFISFILSKKAKGEIYIESAGVEKDKYYLNSFAYFLSPSTKEFNDKYKIVQKSLTSISFVTKNNHDIEEQVADLFSYAAKCKFNRDKQIKKYGKGSYEDKIIGLLEKKLYKLNPGSGEKKIKYMKHVDSFDIIP